MQAQPALLTEPIFNERINMKKVIFGIFIFALCLIFLGAQTNEVVDSKFKDYVPENFSTNDYWFPIGEELVFKALLGFIPVGEATSKIEWGELDGKKVLHIKYVAKSNKVIATIYPIEDIIDVYIDPVTFRSLKYEMKLKEGRHFKHEITTFDYDTMTGTSIRVDKDNRKETFKFSPDARGLFTFMYYMRSRGYNIDEAETFNVVTDGKEYKLIVNPTKVEEIDVGNFGKLEAVRLDPKAEFDGIFITKGKVVAWVSLDSRRLLVRGQIELPFIADVKIVLDAVKGPGDDLWTEHNKKQAEQDEKAEQKKRAKRGRRM